MRMPIPASVKKRPVLARVAKSRSFAPLIHPTNEDLFVGTPLTPPRTNARRGPKRAALGMTLLWF
ncbi:MAG: hypothetical protein WA354_17400 [Terracidiphilus sp.]